MIKIENVKVEGLEPALRGMRNPMNSWANADSEIKFESPHDLSGGYFDMGQNDHKRAMNLSSGGPVHAKYRRMIIVWCDITAPLYWWKEFDTYKVGTVANSCSTMHKIHEKEFTIDDFSCEHLLNNQANEVLTECKDPDGTNKTIITTPIKILELTISVLNAFRNAYLWCNTENKKEYWWQMIQLLPSSYNQRRTVMLSYEVLANINQWRDPHKLDEWVEFCEWSRTLPYSELFSIQKKEEKTTVDFKLTVPLAEEYMDAANRLSEHFCVPMQYALNLYLYAGMDEEKAYDLIQKSLEEKYKN